MKQNNINTVRLCHYPQDRRVFEYGLYVLILMECIMIVWGEWLKLFVTINMYGSCRIIPLRFSGRWEMRRGL